MQYGSMRGRLKRLKARLHFDKWWMDRNEDPEKVRKLLNGAKRRR